MAAAAAAIEEAGAAAVDEIEGLERPSITRQARSVFWFCARIAWISKALSQVAASLAVPDGDRGLQFEPNRQTGACLRAPASPNCGHDA
jgi:hypothetical protein